MPDLNGTLQELFLEIFDIEAGEFSDELSYEETPDWDSLGHMKLVVALSQKFDVEFDIQEVMAMESVAHIKRIVEKKL